MNSQSKWIARIICAAGMLTTMLACSKSSDEDNRPILAVSIEPQRQLLEQLAGDHFRVITIMPPGTNPETYDPTASSKVDLDRSKAYFMIGFLTFETNLGASLDDKATKVVDTSEGITPIYGTHSHNHSHAQFLPGVDDDDEIDADPHTWTSLMNLKTMARTMSNTLVELDSQHADEYAQRLQSVEQHLDSLDNAFQTRLAAAPKKSFVVMHPSFSYFARDYGLKQISISHEDKELSVKNLTAIIDSIRGNGIKVFFYQADMDSRHTQTIANSVDARQVQINPTAYDWESQMTLLVDELTK